MIEIKKSRWRKWAGWVSTRWNKYVVAKWPILGEKRIKYSFFGIIGLIVFSDIYLILAPVIFPPASYDLGRSANLLTEVDPAMTKRLEYDRLKGEFNFTSKESQDSAVAPNSTFVSAKAYTSGDRGVSVTDETNKVAFGLKPSYDLGSGRQDGNRVVYPLRDGNGWLVYTMGATGVKEDILLHRVKDDTAEYAYKLELANGLEPRMEVDGSVGIYGNTVLSSNITTGTEKDAKLLEKARENADKSTLLFRIPKPYVVNHQKKVSKTIRTNYSLENDILTIHVEGLKKATYPISIDPSIYVVTAQQFMRGNNDTNIDFDVANKVIKKGKTTGARFDDWDANTALPNSTWGAGSAMAGGFVYSVGGTSYQGEVFNTQGADTFTVPTGVTSVTIKAWGGGAGGGAGGSSAAGGAGGGAGYTSATFTVSAGQVLDIYVGGGGIAGTRNSAGGGGGGGGHSSVYLSGSALVVSAGGGGGGGGRNSAGNTGGAGGAGGSSPGVSGSAGGAAGGGGGGTTSGTSGSGGAGGTGGNNPGSGGASLSGGAGGDGRTSAGADGSGSAGGLASGGDGGGIVRTARAGGGGGGSGFYGGGGGSGSTSTSGAGGGGGGSNYIAASGTSTTNSQGSGTSPGNSGDSDRAGAGAGGTAGASGGVGTSGANGLVKITYGSGGTSVDSSVNWAQLNTSTGVIDSPNPGTGACSGWCTSSDYSLPSARTNLSLVAYNGYLYALGGNDSSSTKKNSVYIAKLGANGEPQLWHPTDARESRWTYWYEDVNAVLPSARSDLSAVAYNNRLYLVGGRETSSISSSVHIAEIRPNGTLGTWTSSTSLGSARYGHTSLIYNDRIYVIGGAASVGGAPQTTVYYNKINSDGTLNATWQTTTALGTGRLSMGGAFATVWGAYLYVSGGCSTVNGSGYCTTVQSDTQVASINADGSLDAWNTVGSVSSSRIGMSMLSWKDRVYLLGGCSSQNTTTGDCNTNLLGTTVSGDINTDGEASTVGTSVASGTAPCSGASPYSCNLPASGIGNMANIAVILNGYLYIMGGCTNNACSTQSTGVTYQAIDSNGRLQKPATCSGSYTDSFCFNANALPAARGGSGVTVFNNRIYVIGGFTGTSMATDLYYATASSDGSLGTWSAATDLTSIGATDVSWTFAYTRANPASAGSVPGNLYIFGGCSSTTSGIGCGNYTDSVVKCNIATSGAVSSCSESGQTQIGTPTGAGSAGLGAHIGTVYANYIYLMGGLGDGVTDLTEVRYAKFDNNNNVVESDGAGTSAWTVSGNEILVGRRRGAGFGYNGYLYVTGGYDGTDSLADIEFAKINVSDGSIGTWQSSTVTINKRWALSTVVSNSFAYVIGGCTAVSAPGGPTNCNTRTSTVQTFQIYNNNSGAPASYSTSANTYGTSANRIGASSAILNGKLYVAGGCTTTSGASDCTTAITNVTYTTIDAYGALGTWSNTTASLGAARVWGKLLAAGGTLYYVGGQTSGSNNGNTTVYYGTPAGSGDVTTWSSATNGLPAARTKFGAAVWNNRLYVVGGLDGSAAATNTVYVSPSQSSGGNISSAWSTTSTSFNVARSGLSLVAYANNLYLLGGYDGTNYLNDTQFAKISSSDGSVGSWTYSTALPTKISQGDAFATNGYIYLVGGRTDDTTCDSRTLVAPISANTAISGGSGNDPTGVGEWYQTNQKFTGARYGAATSYYDGKLYVMGGGCGSTITYGSPVTQQSTLLTQPMIARYSIPFDTNTNVFPTKWLINGVDNSIGARWQATYRSAYDTYYPQTHATFDTGTNGATIADDETGFDNCNNNATGSRTYNNSNYISPSLSARFAVPSGISGTAFCSDDFTATTQRYDRFYMKIDAAAPSNAFVFWRVTKNDNADVIAALRILNGANIGKLQLRDGSSGTTNTAALTTNTWHRIEVGVVGDRLYLRTFEGSNLNGDVPNQTLDIALTSAAYDDFERASVGVVTSIDSNWGLYIDDYKASSSSWPGAAFPSWGQTTNFGDVTLGTLNTFTPKDSAGSNTSFARWYYMTYNIDAQNTFGYPEDVTRGPTINDLSLQFTADPSRRLMHGGTFIGGEKQPIDTPKYDY